MNKILYITAAVITTCCLSFLSGYAQVNNWFNGDLQTDAVYGISVSKAINHLSQMLPKTSITIAVLDDGIDSNYARLKPFIWKNAGEIAANTKDDDRNGFVDDVSGWNFIASSTSTGDKDNFEITRIVRAMGYTFDSLNRNHLPITDSTALKEYLRLQQVYTQKVKLAENAKRRLEMFQENFDSLKTATGKKNAVSSDFQMLKPTSPIQKKLLSLIVENLKQGESVDSFEQKFLTTPRNYCNDLLDFGLNLNYHPRDAALPVTVSSIGKKAYGNNNNQRADFSHGSQVAAMLHSYLNDSSSKKVSGLVMNVMCVRVLPSLGDERDEDIANAIIYAVNNGAKIINMSFSKEYSPNKQLVDDAVRYAASKDVLLVHAAGNEGMDNDIVARYPNKFLNRTEPVANWIEVGASGMKDDSTLIPDFSNYGKKSVDLFAPGDGATLDNASPQSASVNGTSIAAPLVAEVAGFIRAYFPEFSAKEVKEILLESVSKSKLIVKNSRDGKPQWKELSELCQSGGVLNAANAILTAEKYAKNKRLNGKSN